MGQKIALISGGTSGIGKAAALTLLKEGFKVVAFAPQPSKVKAFGKELAQIFDRENFSVLAGNVKNEAGLKKIVAATLRKFKKVDILINNAGYGYFAEADMVDVSKYRDMMEVNVLGAARLTKLVLPHMKKRRQGLIVNIDSISGRTAGPRSEFYSSTKFALMGYSEGLRKEVAGFGIKVATICPGMVKTNFLTPAEYSRRMKYSWKGKEPVRLGPEDIARSVVFICQQPKQCNVEDIVVMPFG